MTTQTAAICEECGLEKNRWKANGGKGFDRQGQTFCCQGCFLGTGCTCRETGVRRVVVIGAPAPAPGVSKKVGRSIRAWGSKIAALEKRAEYRKSGKGAPIRAELENLKRNARAAAAKAEPPARVRRK